MISALSVATLVSLLLAVLAVNRSAQASRDARQAANSELSAEAIAALDTDPELAVLLAIEALENDPIPEAQEALHRALLEYRLVAVFPAGGVAGSWVDESGIAVVGDDGAITIHEVTTGTTDGEVRHLTTLEAYGAAGSEEQPPVLSASAFTALLAIGQPNGLVTVVDGETGRVLWSLDLGVSTPSISWSPDGRQLVARSLDEHSMAIGGVYEGRSGELVFEFPPCACRPDVDFTSDFNPPRVWTRTKDVEPQDPTNTDLSSFTLTKDTGWVRAVMISAVPGTRAIGVASTFYVTAESADSSTVVIGLTDGEPGAVFTGHSAAVRDVDIGPRQERVVSGGDDGTARVWNPQTGGQELALAGHRGAVVHVQFSPNGERVLTIGTEGTARVWAVDARSVEEVATIDAGRLIVRAYSLGGTRSLTVGDPNVTSVTRLDQLRGFDAGRIGLLDTRDGSHDNTGVLGRVAVHPDGVMVNATVLNPPRDPHGEMQVFRIGVGGGFISRLPADPDWLGVTAIAFNEQGDLLALAHGAGSVSIHHFSSGYLIDGDPVFTFGTEYGVPRKIVFDGELILALYEGDVVRVWDPADGDVVQTISLPADWTGFDVGGGFVVSGDATGNWQMHLIENGDLIAAQLGHNAGISSIVIDAERSLFVTAGFDGVVRLWDLITGDELFTILSISSAVQWLGLSPDGSQLLVVSRDNVVRILAMDVDDLVDIARSKVTRSLTDDECTRYLNTDGCE